MVYSILICNIIILNPDKIDKFPIIWKLNVMTGAMLMGAF